MMKGHGRLKKDIPIYVIDVETWGLDATKIAFGVIMNAQTHEFVVFWTWVEARRILKEMAEESKFVLYAHNGWKYDYLGLFTIDQIKQSNKLDKQGRIIMAQIDGYEARDFKCLVPAPLSVIGEALGYPKGETPLKFKIGDESAGIEQLDIDYCVRDCEILAHAVISLEKTYSSWMGSEVMLDLPYTTASMAYKVWSSFGWPDHWSITSKKDGKTFHAAFVEPKYQRALRDAYYGGRVQGICDVRERIPNVSVVDRNSMYPAEMRRNFPDMQSCRTAIPIESALRALIDSDDTVCWADLRLEGFGKPTFLPGTDELDRRCWTMESYDGWLCEPEIAHALELGYEIKELREVHYAQSITPFTEFVDFFYELRKEMKENNDGRQLWIKIMLAALYGKFGQKPITERVENDEKIEEIMGGPDSEKWEIKYYDGAEGSLPYIIGTDSLRKPRNTWFGFCAFTTSYARVSLNEAILACEGHAVYCDTDSVFVREEGLDALLDHITIGDELGEWGYEIEEPSDFIYYEPKAYVFLNPDGSKKKVRHKGVTTKDSHGNWFPWAGDLTQEQIRLNVVQYRTAMRHGLVLGSGHTQFIHSHRHYGESSPFST